MQIQNINFNFREIKFPKRENTSEIIIKNNLDFSSIINDEYWMQMFEHIWVKHLHLDTKNNCYTNLMFCSKSVHGPLHYHHGSVNSYVINGVYGHVKKSGEEEDYADTGAYVYAPAGSIHKPYMRIENGYFLSFSVTNGAVIYLNDAQEVIGYSDVFTQIDNLKKHFKEKNLPESELKRIIS